MSIDGSAASNFFVVFKKVNCIYIFLPYTVIMNPGSQTEGIQT